MAVNNTNIHEKTQRDTNSDGSLESVRVVVRIRPLLSGELNHTNDGLRINEDEGSITIINPISSSNETNGHTQQSTGSSKKYSFNKVFGPVSSQDDVFDDSGAKNLVMNCLKGYHATIFAYGQTGSGKTHTMDGIEYQHATQHGGSVRMREHITSGSGGEKSPLTFSPHGPGVTPRSISFLFKTIEDMSSSSSSSSSSSVSVSTSYRTSSLDDSSLNLNPNRYSINCSYVQIYKEKVYDLLNPAAMQPSTQEDGSIRNGTQTKGLRMRWSRREGFFLENLYRVACNDVNDALSALGTGARNKIMASHQLNMQSSRSHSIFTLYIKAYETDEQDGDGFGGGKGLDGSDNLLFSSKLSLVDLAGSERGTTIAKNNNRLFEESVSINKSLFTLRKVIQALGKQRNMNNNHKQQEHIPYRDSKLTSLLKESLGGKATSLMIACLSSSDSYYEENLSTLDYASLASRITNKIAINEDHRAKLIRELRLEIEFLKGQLQTVASLHDHIAQQSLPPFGSTSGTNGGGGGGGGGGGAPAAASVVSDACSPSTHGNISHWHNANKLYVETSHRSSAAGRSHTSIVTSHSNVNNNEGTQLVLDEANKQTDGSQSVLVAETSLSYLKNDDTLSISQFSDSNINNNNNNNNEIRHLLELNSALNVRLMESEGQNSNILRDNAILMNENASLREEVTFLEAVVCMPFGSASSSDDGAQKETSGSETKARQMHTASEAVMAELVELRKANKTLTNKVESLHLKKGKHQSSSSATGQQHQQDRLRSSTKKPSLNSSKKALNSTDKTNVTNNKTPKSSSGRLSSTGYVSKTMAKVADEMAKSMRVGKGTNRATSSSHSNGNEDGDVSSDNELVDDNEARLSKLLQARSAMARDHIAKQSSFQ